MNHPIVVPHTDHLKTQEIEFNPKIEAEIQALAATRISDQIGNQATVTIIRVLVEDHTIIVNATIQEGLLAALMRHSLKIVTTLVVIIIAEIAIITVATTITSETADNQLTLEVSNTQPFNLI